MVGETVVRCRPKTAVWSLQSPYGGIATRRRRVLQTFLKGGTSGTNGSSVMCTRVLFQIVNTAYATATSQVRKKRRANEAATHYTPRLRHTYARLREALRPKNPVIPQVRYRNATDTPRKRQAYAMYATGLLICINYASCLGVWPT